MAKMERLQPVTDQEFSLCNKFNLEIYNDF